MKRWATGMECYLGNIGVVYKNQLKYSEALAYHLKALNINEEFGDNIA